MPLNLESTVLRNLNTGESKHKILGVTSAMDGEGKTTVAVGLAVMFANDGVQTDSNPGSGDTLIVDCNPGGHGVTQEFGVELIPGLAQFVQREAPLANVIKPTFLPRLWVMPTGASRHTFSGLLRSPDMRVAMLTLPTFNRIILDLPSVLTTVDTQVLAAFADQLLLVVRAGVTPAKLVAQALGNLDHRKLVGLVLNDRRSELPEWLEQWL